MSDDTAERGPLRVLLFTSLPEDPDPERARLDVEAEQAAVQEALAPWIAEGQADLRTPNDRRLETLTAEVRNFEPHLVFLSGHGEFRHRPLTDEPPHGVFVFEGPRGESDPVPEAEIAIAFVGSRVQCLVLSACESGKTALAGKLAQGGSGRAAGAVFAWSARPENPWEDFRFELELALSRDSTERYANMSGRCRDEACRAKLLLRLLLSQSGNRLVLLLDNLESLQQPDTLALADDETGTSFGAWISAALDLLNHGLVLLLASRWRLPDWPEADHWPLEHASCDAAGPRSRNRAG